MEKDDSMVDKYRLEVSYDCGCSYEDEWEGTDLNEIKDRLNELDKEMLRWALYKNDEQIDISKLHKSIIAELLAFNSPE